MCLKIIPAAGIPPRKFLTPTSADEAAHPSPTPSPPSASAPQLDRASDSSRAESYAPTAGYRTTARAQDADGSGLRPSSDGWAPGKTSTAGSTFRRPRQWLSWSGKGRFPEPTPRETTQRGGSGDLRPLGRIPAAESLRRSSHTGSCPEVAAATRATVE